MNETFIHFPGSAQVRVQVDSVGVAPGIGRHRLFVYCLLSPLNEQTDGVTLSVSGEVIAENLGGGSGYLGQLVPTAPVTLRRDGTFQISPFVEVTDDQVRKIEEHRNHSDGSFTLRLGLRLDGTDREGKVLSNTGSVSNVRVGREDWLLVLQQVKYRRVLVAELEVPDAASEPDLAVALDYYQQAQVRFGAGDYRGTAESIRQTLATLVGEAPEVELSVDAMTAEFREAYKRKGGYDERMELVRKALKFTADLGAHPDTDQTMRAEALAQLHMTAGLLQWFTRPATKAHSA
jgi:hypothetical protein